MLVHFYLSNSAFERLVKLRLQATFQPIDEPFTFNGQNCYMDGFDISAMEIGQSARPLSFVLNRLRGNTVNPAGPAHAYQPVGVTISGALMLTSVAAVRSASAVGPGGRYGLPDRPDNLRIPIFNAQLDVFFTVDTNGVPILNVSLRSLPGAELLGDVPSFLGALQNLTLPFPVADALADVLQPGSTHVLNAGIVSVSDGIAIRLELEPVPDASEGQRMNDWLGFFNGQQPSQLGHRDWAIELPAAEVGANAARDLDDQFNDPDLAKRFTSRGNAWASFVPEWPGFQFHKEGTFIKACAGLDIRAKFLANVTLSAPAPNTLRCKVSLEVDIDDWDSFKCEVVSLLDPFAGLITAIDLGVPWYAFPLVAILQPLLPIAFGLGGDDILVREAIKKVQEGAAKKGVTIVRVDDTHFFADVSKQVTTALTRDWLIVEEVAASGDRLILRGGFTAPDLQRLPRLRGVLTDGFDFWTKKDRCSTNVKWVTVATLSLGLEDEAGAAVRNPVLPILYGIDVERIGGKLVRVGQTTWRIIEDRQGVYGGAGTLIHWTGSPPGVFEFQVTQPRDPYASAPYPLRMQLFTSVGVREFEIPAPPPMPRAPQTDRERLAEAAERISNCYIFSTLLTEVKALQVLWLPNPSPELEVGQHWQVLLRGLDPGDQISAWNAETRELLAEIRTFAGGLTEVSLVLPPAQAMPALQLTLNEAPVLARQEYDRLAAAVQGRNKIGKHPVIILQTPLYVVARVELGQVAQTLVPQRSRDVLTLFATGTEGHERIELNLLEPGRFPVSARSTGQAPAPAQLPTDQIQLIRGSYGGRATAEFLEPSAHGENRVIARYYARPWYDGGGITDQFYTQLDETGRAITVYVRGATRDVAPDIGKREHRY